MRCRSMQEQLSKLWNNDYVLLTKFIAPLIFTNLVVDIGEQVGLNIYNYNNVYWLYIFGDESIL